MQIPNEAATAIPARQRLRAVFTVPKYPKQKLPNWSHMIAELYREAIQNLMKKEDLRKRCLLNSHCQFEINCSNYKQIEVTFGIMSCFWLNAIPLRLTPKGMLHTLLKLSMPRCEVLFKIRLWPST